MKPSVVVALLIGVAIGFGVGRLVAPSSPSPQLVMAEAGPAGGAAAGQPVNLEYGAEKMPGGILDGLNEAQKLEAMKAANAVTCQSCPSDTVARCLGKGHANCEGGQGQLKRAAQMAA